MAMPDTTAHAAHMTIKNTFIEFAEFEEATGAEFGERLRRASSCPSLCIQSDIFNEAVCSEDAKARSQGASPTNEADWCNHLQLDLSSGLLQNFGCVPGNASTAPKNEGMGPSMAEPAEQCLVVEGHSKTPAATRAPLDSQAAMFVPLALRTGSTCSQKVDSTEQVAGLGIPRESKEHGGQTTAMIRNVPCSLSRKGLIQLLDKKGFRGAYNFIYLPVDFKRGLSIGYAFVNFVAPEHLLRFTEVFDGFSFRTTHLRSAKICAVSLSKTQGLTANIERYQNSPVMSDEVPDSYKPVLFAACKRIPFPKPTKAVPQILHRS